MAKIRHIAFIVDEPKKLFDYYHKLFDVEQVRTSPSGSIHVIDGLFNLAFLQHMTDQSDVVGTHRADGTEANQTVGINHFGFTVDKVNDVLSKLPDSARYGENPQNGRPAEMRVIDQWGNNFDLSSRGFLGREEKPTTGIRHVVVHNDHPEEAAEFFKSVLDLREVHRGAGEVLLTDGDISFELTKTRTLDRSGIQNLGIQIKDWAEMEARFEEHGFDLPLPKAGETEVRLRDPEGNLYALSQRGWLD